MSEPVPTRAVLGIDAAWTAGQPSGVALVCESGGRWRLASVAPSYPAYLERATANGHLPDGGALVHRTEQLCGRTPDVVAIDMPLSRKPIICRRAADDAVSRAYGARHCSTHTPSALRPGPISDNLTAAFANSGFGLATEKLTTPALIEVYPHPALVELTAAARRLPYKIGKVRAYWPDLPPAMRRTRLFEVWMEIVGNLEDRIAGVRTALPAPDTSAPLKVLKAYEDQLDAVICAWVGVCYLEGTADPFGDADAAIWIPVRL